MSASSNTFELRAGRLRYSEQCRYREVLLRHPSVTGSEPKLPGAGVVRDGFVRFSKIEPGPGFAVDGRGRHEAASLDSRASSARGSGFLAALHVAQPLGG